MKHNKLNGAVTTGVFAALGASSCCIPPIIVAISGVGGVSSSLSWMEPFRPYLIAIAALSISYAWYAYLNPKKSDDCDCTVEKLNFFQKRGFLIGMTLFALISITMPYYSHLLVSNNKKEVLKFDSINLQNVNIRIEGMTCDACQNHINYAIQELDGIISVNTSYKNQNTLIQFDKTLTTLEEINEAILSTGYVPLKNK